MATFIIPNQPRLGGEWKQPTPDAGSAIAVSQATSQLGEAGLGLGLQLTAVNQKIDAMRKSDILRKQRIEMARLNGRQQEMRSDPTGLLSKPHLWQSSYDEDYKATREAFLSNPDLNIPEDMYAEVSDNFELMKAQEHFEIGTQHMQARVRDSIGTLKTAISMHETVGDYAAANGEVDDALRNGLLTEQEAASYRNGLNESKYKWDKEQLYQNEVATINSDPRKWLDETGSKGGIEGVDPTTFATLNRHAQAEVNRQDAAEIDRAEDWIVNQGTKPPLTTAEVDKEFPNLRPATREKLKSWILRRNSAAAELDRADPNYQMQLKQDINRTISGWTPTMGRDADLQYADLLTKIDQVNDGDGFKAEAKDRVNRIKQEGKRTMDDPLEYGMDMISRAGDIGTFGRRYNTSQLDPVSKVAISQLIGDGFLRDTEKLRKLGFSDTQITQITGKDSTGKIDPELIGGAVKDGKVTKGSEFDAKKTKYSKEGMQQEQVWDRMREDAFQALWTQRANPKAVPANESDQFIFRTAEAIHARQPTVEGVDNTSEVAQRRQQDATSRRQEGEATQNFSRWYRDRTGKGERPTLDEVDAWMGKELKLNSAQSELNKYRPPARGEGQRRPAGYDEGGNPIDNSTSSTDMSGNGPGVLPPLDNVIDFGRDGIKLSNYGYPGDANADRNSLSGIGHNNNPLRSGSSVAISASLASRMGLNRGDRLQLDTSNGTFVVTYDDTVPSKDPKTGRALPETFDIYRKDGSNSWGGKVHRAIKLS